MKARFMAVVAVIAAVSAVGGYFLFEYFRPAEITDLPQIVVIPAGEYNIRLIGDYRIDTQIVDAPIQLKNFKSALRIMKYQVSQDEYDLCVQDHGCPETHISAGENMPQVAISYYDAIASAKWFSTKTKLNWRLPTAQEWQRAAGDKYVDPSFGNLNDKDDPAKRWVLEYKRQTQLRGESDLELRPRGTNGENNLGLFDVSSNVWEWTTTCFLNSQLDTGGEVILETSKNCVVRAVQGKHVAYIVDFIRDANVGGCAAGIPPDFLGFRLILE